MPFSSEASSWSVPVGVGSYQRMGSNTAGLGNNSEFLCMFQMEACDIIINEVITDFNLPPSGYPWGSEQK